MLRSTSHGCIICSVWIIHEADYFLFFVLQIPSDDQVPAGKKLEKMKEKQIEKKRNKKPENVINGLCQVIFLIEISSHV